MKHMIFLVLTIINRNIATLKMKRHNSTPKLSIFAVSGVKPKFEFLWNFLLVINFFANMFFCQFSVCLLKMIGFYHEKLDIS